MQPHFSPPPPIGIAAPPPLQLPPAPPAPPAPTPPVIAPPAPVSHTISNAVLDRQPNADDMAQYYPERAQRLEKTGSATIKCGVTAQGKLINCQVTGEEPGGYDFGSAALKLSKLFKLRPETSDGKPVDGGTWSTKIVFRLAGD
jgi:protein TonB